MSKFDFDDINNSTEYYSADTAIDPKKIKAIFDKNFAFELENLIMRPPFNKITDIDIPSWYINRYTDDTRFSVNAECNFVDLSTTLNRRVCIPIYSGSTSEHTPVKKFINFAKEYDIKFKHTPLIVPIAYDEESDINYAKTGIVDVELPDMGFNTYYVYLINPVKKLKFPNRKIKDVMIICSNKSKFKKFNIDLDGLHCHHLIIQCHGKNLIKENVKIESIHNFEAEILDLTAIDSIINRFEFFKNAKVSDYLNIECAVLNSLVPGLFEAKDVEIKASYITNGLLSPYKDLIVKCCNKNIKSYAPNKHINLEYYLNLAKLAEIGA